MVSSLPYIENLLSIYCFSKPLLNFKVIYLINYKRFNYPVNLVLTSLTSVYLLYWIGLISRISCFRKNRKLSLLVSLLKYFIAFYFRLIRDQILDSDFARTMKLIQVRERRFIEILFFFWFFSFLLCNKPWIKTLAIKVKCFYIDYSLMRQ